MNRKEMCSEGKTIQADYDLQSSSVRQPVRPPLLNIIAQVAEKCLNCEVCQKECAFLRKYGKPGKIAESYDPADSLYKAMAFDCSLCRLCTAVCPVQVDPAEMFLEMRREKMRIDPSPYPEHGGLLSYEKKGNSKLFTYYALPAGCDTVFFPGCSLAGTRPEQTFKLYEKMKQWMPQLGIVLDCCDKISHDLGREKYFLAIFGEMNDYLIRHGIKKVIAACPNCFNIFEDYGEGLSVTTVYEVLAENMPPPDHKRDQTVSIHDPCGLRFNNQVHASVRCLVTQNGLQIEELRHNSRKTICCGEGGSVGCLSPELADNWGNIIKDEAKGGRLLTYCAGCANHMNGLTSTSHIIDFLFDPEATLAGNAKIAKAPITYLNRLKLKRRFRKEVEASETRERTFSANEEKKGVTLKRLLALGLLAGAIFLVRYTGSTKYLDQENLRQLIASYGMLAPLVYMLIYAIAPALLLPGLPITVAGGILFGPFWGVIYTIISSTIGACFAFLISRYVARDWIEKKLRSPRWRRLDKGVEKHGWKVVAFTRLIPLFPFNLLNYAFGLTRIGFWPYALATFIFMLPACIAFIVFSSSLLDLVRGKVSYTLIIGIVLVVLVSLIPFFYQRYQKKKSIENPL